MLFNLVKKDFILAKYTMIFVPILMIGVPILFNIKFGLMSGGLLGFLFASFFVQFMLFNTVSLSEFKYKGSALLCATPYTRNALVKERYLFIFMIFLSCYIIYAITAFFTPQYAPMLNIVTSGYSLLLIIVYFAIIIPLQYQFGFEKTKQISILSIVLSPYVFPNIFKALQTNDFSLMISSPVSPTIQRLLPYLLALVISFVSMIVSIHIYSKKNL